MKNFIPKVFLEIHTNGKNMYFILNHNTRYISQTRRRCENNFQILFAVTSEKNTVFFFRRERIRRNNHRIELIVFLQEKTFVLFNHYRQHTFKPSSSLLNMH